MNFVSKLVVHLGMATLLGVVALSSFAAPRKVAPTPSVRIDLAPLGLKPIAKTVTQSEMSVLTVNFVTPERLLVTFVVRKLIPRSPDQQETDRDRIIHAALMELPSGKVLAEKDWRMHDSGRYLWPLEGGRFLIRSRDTLSVVSPLEAKPGEELMLHPVAALNHEGTRLRSIMLTSDGRLAAIQTDVAPKIGDDPDLPRSDKVELRFYRVSDGMFFEQGHVSLNHVVAPAFNEQGFLESLEDKPPFWGFDLQGFAGGKKELAAIESSCQPSATFISSGEFLISACRGGDVRSMIGVLNLNGDVLWLGPGPSATWGAVVSAPAAERIAIRNTLSEAADFADPTAIVGPKGQEITVYRTYTGEKLLTVPIQPCVQAPQNFALSSNGARLAVWQDGFVEVYDLPPVTVKDLEIAKKSAERVELTQAASR